LDIFSLYVRKRKTKIIEAIRAIIPPKIKGAPGPMFLQRNPAASDEKKGHMPTKVR
jgi:hypothetical protein